MKKLIIALTIIFSSSIANAGVLDLVEKQIPVPFNVSCEDTLTSKGYNLKKYGKEELTESRILDVTFNTGNFDVAQLYYTQANKDYDFSKLMIPVYFKGDNMILCVWSPTLMDTKNPTYSMFVMSKIAFDSFVIEHIKEIQSTVNNKEEKRKNMFNEMLVELDSLN